MLFSDPAGSSLLSLFEFRFSDKFENREEDLGTRGRLLAARRGFAARRLESTWSCDVASTFSWTCPDPCQMNGAREFSVTWFSRPYMLH